MKIHYSKMLGASFALALLGFSASAQTGIGTGTTAPRTMLDVNGAISVTETVSPALTGANPSFVVPINVSQVQLIASGTAPSGTIAVTATSPVTGQQLAIFNNTAIPATLSGQTIQAGQATLFVFSNGGWQTTSPAAINATALTVNNGLTKTSTTVALGGPLIQATAIPLANNNITFSTGTTGTGVLILDGQGGGSSSNAAKQHIEFTSNSDPNAVIGHTVVSGTSETNDLFLYSGNDPAASVGPDRIRLMGENILFQSFNNATNSTIANAEANTNTNTNMFIGASGNVGIGTSVPNAPLQFPNTLATRKIVLWETGNNDNQFYGLGINSSMLRYQVDATSATHAFFAGTSATTSNELMRISGNGNVGIGTAAPTAMLDVLGTVRLETLTGTGSRTVVTDATGNLSTATAASLDPTTASNGLTKTANNTVLGGPLTQATAIALGSNNLSFSSSAAASTLTVGGSTGNVTLATGTIGTGVLVLDGQGGGSSSNAAKQHIEFTSNSDTNAVIGHTVVSGTSEINDLFLYVGNDNVATAGPDRIRLVGENILFQSFNNASNSTIANAEGNLNTQTNMFISSGGNVGIGTVAPNFVLDVASPNATTLNVSSTAGDINGIIQLKLNRASASVDEYIEFFDTNSSGQRNIGNITANGSGGMTYNTTSDQRLKENIRTSQFGLAAIMKIGIHDYNYKADAAKTLQTGVMAQQLYTVFPQAVSVGDEDVNKKPWMVDYSKLTPVLVRAMQEQQAEIEALKAANAGLKASLDGKASASTMDEMQAALQALRAEVQTLKAGTSTASTK